MTFVTTVDTLQFSKRMQKAGFEQKAADELAEAIKEIQTTSSNEVATKHDLLIVKNELKAEINLVRAEIKNAMLTTIISIGGIVVTAIGFVSWLFKMT